jgi:hypothetical protein
MPFEGQNIQRVAFAGGCAFALAKQLRLFDTEVHREITEYFDILKTARSISADGGTNITKVFEDVDDMQAIVGEDEGLADRLESMNLRLSGI